MALGAGAAIRMKIHELGDADRATLDWLLAL